MKTDISKLPLKEWKHSLGVFLQMGRVQLESDWNEQTELSLRLLQRQTEDSIGTGSPNHGFRVDDRVLIDAMDSSKPWAAEKAIVTDPDPVLYVDYFDFKTGEGSLSLEGGAVLTRKLPTARDLSRWKEIVLAAKGTFVAGELSFFLGQAGARGILTTTEDPAPIDGWRIFRADPSTAAPAVDFTQIDEFGFIALNNARKYQFDYIKVDSSLREVLVKPTSAAPFTATTSNPGDVAQLTINDTDHFWHSLVLEATNVTSVSYELPTITDLTHVRKLIVAARTGSGAAPAINVTLTDAASTNLVLGGAVITTVGSWQVSSFAVPQGVLAWGQVKSIRWDGLTPATVYRFAPVLGESDLHNNLVIMGGDGTSEGAGRFYGDGLAAIKESHETYFTQKDLPKANPLPLAAPPADQKRIDLAYLDLWERPITYIEDADIREIALEGPDTCTRTKLIAQVRVLKGVEVPIPHETAQLPQTDFDNLPQFGGGLLTTKDKADVVVDACADPCEPAIAGTFLGEENRLFRIEIHNCGQIGPAASATTAIFKWSRENGAIATAIIANADAGAFSVKVEKPELYEVGDLIEISNDLIELVTGPYEDRVNHRCHPRGELRKITAISLPDRLISWQDAGSPEPQFHAPLPEPERLVYHPSVRRWDGVLPVTPGDIVLADGVVIEFGGSDMVPGDYWVFATRVVDRSVERLVEQPPHGILHRYFPLAQIERSKSGTTETVTVRDVRPHFDALTRLKATDIAFDPSACVLEDPSWASIENVQQAIDALCQTDLGLTIEDHNKHLHGPGIVCGFQVHCNQDRKVVTIEKGYALDCSGHVIRSGGPLLYDVVKEAMNIQALDGAGNGEVLLSMTRGGVQDAVFHVDPPISQTFWESVLEGTLLLDVYNDCILNVVKFFKSNFLPFSSNVPVSEQHKRLVSVLNLVWSKIQAATGPYVFLSQREADDPRPMPDTHKFLHRLYDDFKNLIASNTFCAMFDNVTPFPDYPYLAPAPGIDTVFGLFNFHSRLRLHPNGKLAYTCGLGNKISVFDMATRALIASLDFPGGSNAEVKDVALSPDGKTLYAVAILNNQDSVFARASIDLGTNVHTWGPTNVVCDILFVTLGTTTAHPQNLYAIGLSKGLFILDPMSIPLTPSADVPFNATGVMHISVVPDEMIAGEAFATPLNTAATSFDRCSMYKLNALPAPPAPPTPALPAATFNCSGIDAENDITMVDDAVFITGTLGADKGLFRFDQAGGTAISQVDLQTSSYVRLAATPDKQWMVVSVADKHKLERVDITLNPILLDTRFRVPVQIIPFDIVTNTTTNEIYALNLVSGTLSTVDIKTVFATTPLLYTAEPPVELATYHQQIIQAFSDLFMLFGQYLKDCFCEHFLVNCPECDKIDKVYLGGIEIQGGQVYKICNFTKRRYVKSEQMVEYWLSTIPIIPIFKKMFAEFCCKVI